VIEPPDGGLVQVRHPVDGTDQDAPVAFHLSQELVGETDLPGADRPVPAE
jgi:hypothetical protein